MSKLEKHLPEGYSMTPYGYDSYEAYYTEMDKYADEYFRDSELSNMYGRFKETMQQMNVKENWSVLRYIGKNDDRVFGLTHGQIYYWPCSLNNPVYEGVIDDEEFTSYWYPTEASDWEIIDDPTGMAGRTIYDKAKGYADRKKYNGVMSQVKAIMTGAEP